MLKRKGSGEGKSIDVEAKVNGIRMPIWIWTFFARSSRDSTADRQSNLHLHRIESEQEHAEARANSNRFARIKWRVMQDTRR